MPFANINGSQMQCEVIHLMRNDDIKNDPALAEGMKTRRAVLGDAHVDRAIENIDDFTRDFQRFIMRYAWQEIWSRPGLPCNTRSMITLATLVALRSEDEFRMHLRAALRNGITPEQIREVLLHSAIYCGLPAANRAFHLAQEILRESGMAQEQSAQS
jgi:3-oxoadipate enol-lactonase/4-carboxymuconolactone decarboxylase